MLKFTGTICFSMMPFFSLQPLYVSLPLIWGNSVERVSSTIRGWYKYGRFKLLVVISNFFPLPSGPCHLISLAQHILTEIIEISIKFKKLLTQSEY